MKNFILAIGLIYSVQAHAQGSFRIQWFHEDLSLYSTYMIGDFVINDTPVDYNSKEEYVRFLKSFNYQMSKIGLNVKDSSILVVNMDFSLDTLAIGHERPNGVLPEDLLSELTLTLIDAQVNERLFIGNVIGLGEDRKKFNKGIKAMVRKFFRKAR
ncbi:MAG: hypothetical protein JXR03_18160 [Cyclobacteriaceae bacterium]